MEKKYTPMIMQYLEVKRKYQDSIVFYRLGDFYEMFFEDAKIASSVLDLVLTARGKDDNAVPMCGVPHHSASSYIQKLVNSGYKVAIVEQLEEATAGKIVERDVIKVITPGTIFNEEDLKEIHYLVSIYDTKFSFVLIYLDHYSGEMFVKEIARNKETLHANLVSSVKEVIIKSDFIYKNDLKELPYTCISNYENIDEYQHLNPYQDVSIIAAFEMLLSYLIYTQKRSIPHLQMLYKLNESDFMVMDQSTKNNLELVTSTKSKKYSLWGFLDRCITTMGSRNLLKWVEYPLIDEVKINQRLDIVEKLKDNLIVQRQLKDELSHIFDIKRLYSKIAYGSISPKELLKLKETLQYLPKVISTFSFIKSYSIDLCDNLLEELDRALLDNPSTLIKDGNVFKDDYHSDLEEYRKLQNESSNYILELELKEREKTKIKNLKIGYTRVFGYYIEISKGQVENVKDEFGYIRRQTLANCERYISEELKMVEEKLLSAKDNAIRLEIQLYEKLLNKITKYQKELNIIADVLSEIDSYYALSIVSSQFGYVRPTFDSFVSIEDGRHPILETLIKNNQYISNDYTTKENKFMILTGPNMGGKSTYMRQNALISIMSQIGCFVPARKAQLKIFNKIFTRMGASDDILSAQSTFMVEMSEANHALRNADSNSLILFDEIGRGTSTYDGMSLAWAIIEYIHLNLHSSVIFSTHYHELTQLSHLDGIENYHVEVHEENDHVTFLYKVKSGYVDKSYGINVAKLAKLPNELIYRSKVILDGLKKDEIKINSNISQEIPKASKTETLLQEADVDNMTPLEALLFVAKLKQELENE